MTPLTTLTPGDIAQIDNVLAHVYGDERYEKALVVDGYRVRIAVEHNHLKIDDGIGTHRRSRTLTRSQTTVKRIVIVGDAGTISLAAIYWCVETGISLTQVASDGRVLAETVASGPREARLRRAQALAPSTGVGLEIAKMLIEHKLTGHERNLADRFTSEGAFAAEEIRSSLDQAQAATGTTELRTVEARCAAIYFDVWRQNVAVSFATRDSKRVPSHWLIGNPRTSHHRRAGRSPRGATDPVNAMLNYAYALAEIECRIACVAVGLDPALGVMHADVKHRESMALDLLEAIRPDVEMTVLDLVRLRKFRAIDFIETSDGTCRLTESTTHPLTEAMAWWAKAIAPIAEAVSHMVGATSTTRVQVRTPLTRSRHHQANSARAGRSSGESGSWTLKALSSTSLVMPTCIDCGTPLSTKSRKRCGPCDELDKVGRMIGRGAFGRETSAQLSVDPAQSPEARRARIQGITASRRARDAWDAEHTVSEADRLAFEQRTLPLLSGVPLSRIVEVTGVSISAASLIRSGKFSPHARHWPALAKLVARVTKASDSESRET